MSKLRLQPGNYRAITEVVLSLFCGAQQKEYRTIKAGDEFAVPQMVPPFAYFAVYHPDFGDVAPKFAESQSA